MRISDWSSDVCSSNLSLRARFSDGFRAHKPAPRIIIASDISDLHSSLSGGKPNRETANADANSNHERCNARRSEEHTSELQSLMRISYAVFCLKKKKK